MHPENPWHEDDCFWEALAPFFFSLDRIDNAGSDIDGVIALLNLSPGMKVLDLCCGPGLHTCELAKRGYHITAVDRTRIYLDRAERRAAEMAVDVEFIQDDMRRFVRPDSFDAVINICTSFGYFEDQNDDRRTARNMYRSLKPGGQVVFDMVGREILSRIYTRRDWRKLNDSFLLEERIPNDDWSIMNSRYVLIADGRVKEFTLALRIYSVPELSELLADEGFTDIRIYGNLHGRPYDEMATRLVVAAKK